MNCPVAPGLGMPVVEITNVIMNAHLGTALNLAKLCTEVPQLPLQYNASDFSMAKMHMENPRLYPRVTLLIADTGGVTVAGAGTPDAALMALHDFAALLRRTAGVPARVHGVQLSNLVAHAKFDFYVDAAALQQRFGAAMHYTPQRFCGAIISGMIEGAPSVTFTVYINGAVVITGARSAAELGAAIVYLDREMRSAGAVASSSSVVPHEHARAHLLRTVYSDGDAGTVAAALQRLAQVQPERACYRPSDAAVPISGQQRDVNDFLAERQALKRRIAHDAAVAAKRHAPLPAGTTDADAAERDLQALDGDDRRISVVA
jgi:TATA-box binding protein (TBP) (component of TFIID and TFIIIB)